MAEENAERVQPARCAAFSKPPLSFPAANKKSSLPSWKPTSTNTPLGEDRTLTKRGHRNTGMIKCLLQAHRL